MKRWYLLGIRTQILAFYIAASVLIVGVMRVALFLSTTSIIRQEAANTTAMAIDKSGRQLEMYIEQLNGLSELLAHNPQVNRYFGGSLAEDGASIEDRADIEVLVATILETNQEIASIILIGADGRLITNEENLDMTFTGSIRDQSWYKAALGSKMPILTSARMQEFSMDKDNWVISLGRELKDEKDQHLGVLRIDLRYDTIESILQDLNLGEQGYAFILNQNKQVVYHPNPEFFSQEDKQQELINVLEMEDGELSREQVLIHRIALENTDWLLLGVASLDGVKRMQKDIIMVLGILVSVMLIVALGSSSIFANSVTRPIRKLEKAMAKVEQGVMDTKVSVMGSAEIQSLSNHFQDMMDRIRDLMDEIRGKEQSLRASELKTLYSQINPHFLYNTLDTIVWLAEFGNMERVVSVSKAMARFFRLSLRGGSELTTVREELNHVRQYLFIQKEHYQDKLAYEIVSDETLLDITIPKILLQPLVENSIYHGIRQLPGTGLIRITAARAEDALLLSVKDNGIGFKTVDTIWQNSNTRLGGVGLKNVDERIRLYYGEGYGLVIRNDKDGGVTVTLRLGIESVQK